MHTLYFSIRPGRVGSRVNLFDPVPAVMYSRQRWKVNIRRYKLFHRPVL